jgi:hypothetical protein
MRRCSVAACDGASPAEGTRQPRANHNCKQYRLLGRVRQFLDKTTQTTVWSSNQLSVPSSDIWPISDLFRKVRSKRRFVKHAIRTGRATPTRQRRQAAARLAFHCADCIVKRCCEPPPRLVHGRRASCVKSCAVSLPNKAESPHKPVLGPTCSFRFVSFRCTLPGTPSYLKRGQVSNPGRASGREEPPGHKPWNNHV